MTRVYDATPLDNLGVPVWAAVTPLARDLTVHAGKGPTPQAARISAIMEAIERVCAEQVDWRRARVAAFDELSCEDGSKPLDPELFDLPFDTTYAHDVPIAWINGYDLLEGRVVWVPLDLVISPPTEGVCTSVETNGLAAGNCYTEAVVHAVHEVIERDAIAQYRFMRQYAARSSESVVRMIDVESLPRCARELATQLSERTLRLAIQDLTHDIGVPVFRATMSDRYVPGREGQLCRFEGFGCDLDATGAVIRALSEVAQAHTALIVGARDAFEDGGMPAVRSAETLVARLVSNSSLTSFPPNPDGELPSDLRLRLDMLLKRLDGAGLRHCVVVDLARQDLGVPVVRVLIPGCAGPYGETARRPAWRLLRRLV